MDTVEMFNSECGFKLSETSEKAKCTQKRKCEICSYCQEHCLVHYQIREFMDPRWTKTEWSELGKKNPKTKQRIF